MSALAPELVPPRSLDLPGVVWGIDPSTRRISVGILAPGAEPQWHTLSLAQGANNAFRLSGAMDLLPDWFLRLTHPDYPALVVVEQPFAGGRHVQHESLHMVGVVLGSLYQYHVASEILMMGPGTWKSKALGAGHGRAEKPEIMRWARECCGYTADLQDEADALGIATAGGVLLAGKR